MGFVLHLPRLVWRALNRADDHGIFPNAAAIAFYTIFSLPALLVVAITVAGALYGTEAAESRIVAEVGRQIGEGAAKTLEGVIRSAWEAGAGQALPRYLAIAALLFAATGAFFELQRALNKAWEVGPPRRRWYIVLVIKRLISFAMVVVAGLLLVLSVSVSIGLATLGDWLVERMPRDLALGVVRALDLGVSLTALALLFALLFKVLPDGRVRWRKAWMGAAVTSILFVAGKYLVSLYLSTVNVGSAYGAAGSLVILLIWIYVSCIVILFGGEFAAVWDEDRAARHAASAPRPAHVPPARF